MTQTRKRSAYRTVHITAKLSKMQVGLVLSRRICLPRRASLPVTSRVRRRGEQTPFYASTFGCMSPPPFIGPPYRTCSVRVTTCSASPFFSAACRQQSSRPICQSQTTTQTGLRSGVPYIHHSGRISTEGQSSLWRARSRRRSGPRELRQILPPRDKLASK